MDFDYDLDFDNINFREQSNVQGRQSRARRATCRAL